jgi:hypothetical protein
VAVPRDQAVVPTFAEYVPVVSAAVTAGTRRAYGSYWNRIVEQWGERRLDEPSPSDIRQLMTWVKTHVVASRNARGGRSAQEHLVAALRCLYRRAVEDGLIAEAENPAQKVAKAAPPADHPAGAWPDACPRRKRLAAFPRTICTRPAPRPVPIAGRQRRSNLRSGVSAWIGSPPIFVWVAIRGLGPLDLL